MMVVPVEMPVTKAVVGTIVATDGKLLDHVPPGLASVKETVPPKHTEDGPVIMTGNGLTVIVLEVEQPVAIAYVMTAVPGVIPVTSPAELTGATAGLLVDHMPPPVASLKVITSPTQTVDGPVIGAGNALIVTG